ncbi:SGNH/GDSL hydrolase family protein [Patescibacteria group bacterium]|nr:SGNH/GDSL hydrolase family protein [Patescibacteria group bacterium]
MLKTKTRLLVISGFIFALALCLFSFSPHSQATETTTVLTLGDSITHGYPYIDTSYTYPAQLSGMLGTTSSYYIYNVSNHGVSGYRADQVLASLQSQDWLAENPSYVLLMVGGNDLAQEISPDLSNISAVLDQTVSEVQQIVDYVKAHQNADGSTPTVILSAYPPNNLYGPGGSLVINEYNTRLANNITGHDHWFTTNWDDLYDSETGQAKTSLMTNDAAHPNTDGYAVIANNWYEIMYPLLPNDPDDPNPKNPDDPIPPVDPTTPPLSDNLDPKIITTSGPGATTRLQAYERHGNAEGSEITNLFPDSYTGGAGIVAIDANNNYIKDQFLVFALENGGPQARVFGLRDNGEMVFQGQMFVFDETIRDGLSMTVGDFDQDGFEDDVAACLTGDKAPTIKVYTNAIGVDNWQKVSEFTANFGAVGCNLGTYQYGDQTPRLLVTPHHGPADPKVYIYETDGTLERSFTAYGAGVTNGLTASGIQDRIYTTPNNGTSHVMVFDEAGTAKNFWWAYDNMNVKGDFKNVAGDIDLDGKDEILISPIGANGPQVLSFEASGKWRTWPNFFAFGDPSLRNGVGIAVIENYHGEN